MSYTAIPGTVDCQPGNVLPGSLMTDLIATASNTITFGQQAFCNFQLGENSVTFSQSVGIYNATPHSSSQITFSQLASYLIVKSLSPNNTLTFSQVAENVHIHKTSNSLTFAGVADYEIVFAGANQLTWTQTTVISDYIHNENIGNFLPFTETVVVQKITNAPASNTITFVGSTVTKRVKFASASNVFNVTNNATISTFKFASNTIIFTQSTDVDRILHLSASNSIQFTDSVSLNTTFNLHPSNTLTFIGGQVRDLGFIYQPIPSAVVTKVNTYVLLQASTAAITLPRPKFEDLEGLMAKLVKNKAIEGTKYVYVRRSKTRKLKYSFEVDRPKGIEMRHFILTHLADPITLTNWKGEIWKGYIMNNPLDLGLGGRWAPVGDRVDFDLEFEGARIH